MTDTKTVKNGHGMTKLSTTFTWGAPLLDTDIPLGYDFTIQPWGIEILTVLALEQRFL